MAIRAYPELSIVERAQALFEAPIYGLIGGLHLLARGGLRSAPMVAVGGDRFPLPGDAERRVREAIATLKRANLSVVGPSPHDSTEWTIGEFRKSFGDCYREVAARN